MVRASLLFLHLSSPINVNLVLLSCILSTVLGHYIRLGFMRDPYTVDQAATKVVFPA